MRDEGPLSRPVRERTFYAATGLGGISGRRGALYAFPFTRASLAFVKRRDRAGLGSRRATPRARRCDRGRAGSLARRFLPARAAEARVKLAKVRDRESVDRWHTARETHRGAGQFRAMRRHMGKQAEPWPLRERRAAPRAAVMLHAMLESDGSAAPVRLINVSKKGSSLVGDIPPEPCWVTLHRNGIPLRGRIAWALGDRAGVDFDGPVDPRQMLRPLPPQRTPWRQPAKRPPVRSSALSRAERALLERCADLLGVTGIEPAR